MFPKDVQNTHAICANLFGSSSRTAGDSRSGPELPRLSVNQSCVVLTTDRLPPGISNSIDGIVLHVSLVIDTVLSSSFK